LGLGLGRMKRLASTVPIQSSQRGVVIMRKEDEPKRKSGTQKTS
jgi:anti-sigma regulatory factor (Ser/Thr protein kinase)